VLAAPGLSADIQGSSVELTGWIDWLSVPRVAW
jgi:hypothetical protein